MYLAKYSTPIARSHNSQTSQTSTFRVRENKPRLAGEKVDRELRGEKYVRREP